MVPTEGLGEFGLYASRTSHRLGAVRETTKF